MDAHTEQTYQQRIEELEAFVISLKAQLTQRDQTTIELRVQLTQRDATIAALQQQVAELSKQGNRSRTDIWTMVTVTRL